MEITQSKINTFTDLKAWREAHKLVLMTYRSTKIFPADEKFGLINQARRSAVSITSNIAEGFSRRTAKDKVSFYSIAKGSLTELQNQFLIARDLRYLDQRCFKQFADQSVRVSRLLTGLTRSAKSK